MDRQIHHMSRCLGREFTFEEWVAYLKAHPYAACLTKRVGGASAASEEAQRSCRTAVRVRLPATHKIANNQCEIDL